MPKSKYYKILGLPQGASQDAIRKKYRILVMKYHPDKNPAPGAEAKFIQITEAYEILSGKRPAPAAKTSRGRSQRGTTTNNGSQTTEEQQQQRAREAQARQRAQRYKEYVENEMYFRKLTRGYKWKVMRISAFVGILLSTMLILDEFLPHHYKEDKVVGFNMNSAYGLGGVQISLVKLESNEYYWVEHINYNLYGDNYHVLVESSWFFHNPIQLVSLGKLEYDFFRINFNFYKLSWLLILLFLLPGATLLYKRRKISFTVLFHFCYYGVNLLMLLFLLTGHRWAHVLTFGFI